MKKFVTYLSALLLMAACSTVFAVPPPVKSATGNLGNPGVAPPQSMPYGKSYAEWSMAWWMYCFPKTLDVLPFGEGTDGTFGQSGPVWFLGGTFTGDNLTRAITIPAGTALFFPIRNCECSTLESGDWHGDNEAELRACANGWIENYALPGLWGSLDCIIDRVPLQNVTQYRCQTPLMSITLPADMPSNIFGVPTTAPTPVLSVGDGLYVFLNPLPIGVHTLQFGGVSYTVTVSSNLGNPGVLPPQSHAYGKTYAEWSAAWWQWALGLPADQNPFYDGSTPETYGQCSNGANGQSGPVWFLTGVISVSGQAVRSCTVPAGKALFFPVINSECSTLEAPPFYGGNYEELVSCVQSLNVGNLYAEIDGVAVKNLGSYFVTSPMYTFRLPENNALGLPGPQTGQSVSYGSWLMLAPLAPGAHVIHFGGTYTDFNFTLDITYILTVQ